MVDEEEDEAEGGVEEEEEEEEEAKLGEMCTHANSVLLDRRTSTASALPPVTTAQSGLTALSPPLSV